MSVDSHLPVMFFLEFGYDFDTDNSYRLNFTR